jgi:hypothetical protein
MPVSCERCVEIGHTAEGLHDFTQYFFAHTELGSYIFYVEKVVWLPCKTYNMIFAISDANEIWQVESLALFR